MELIWHILLTVCSGTTCLEQDVQWFDTKQSCEVALIKYVEVPPDGDWDEVQYVCKPVGSKST